MCMLGLYVQEVHVYNKALTILMSRFQMKKLKDVSMVLQLSHLQTVH